MRVCRQKREGTLGVALVLGQVKGHATQHLPYRVDLAQIRHRSFSKVGRLRSDEVAQLDPQPSKQVGVEVFEPAHWRRLGHKLGQLVVRRR